MNDSRSPWNQFTGSGQLRDAGLNPEVICKYLGVAVSALEGIYQVAAAKLIAAQNRIRSGYDEDH